MADRFAHAAHLTVASLSNRQQQHRILVAAPWRDQDDGRRQRAVAVERDALAQAGQRVFVRRARDARLVGALDAVSRVGEPRREVAVVGEEQQALAVVVEPADRIDVLANACRAGPSPCGAAADRSGSSHSPSAC